MKAFAAGLVSLMALSGCSSSAPPKPTVPVTEPVALTTLATTTVPTTLPPVTATAVPLATTTTLRFGLTDADRMAVEAAATEWFREFARRIDALPEFKPNELFELAEPGSPAAARYAVILQDLSEERLEAIPATIDQVAVLSVQFETATVANVIVCVAENGGAKNADTGVIEEPTTLGRGRHLLTLRKAERWLISTDATVGELEEGKTCDVPFQ
jgi:hypothetical protein